MTDQNKTPAEPSAPALSVVAGSALDRPHFRSIENPEGDWTEDFDHENGNYCNNCIGCKKTFVGHKRRYVCKKCAAACKARWDAMTPEEQAEEERTARQQIADFFKQNMKSETRDE